MGKSIINAGVVFTCLLLLLSQACNKNQQKINTAQKQESAFAEHVRTTPYQTAAQEQRSFRLPPGFEITLFASEPDISKPMNIAFDDRGRLWVTQSAEYPYAAETGKGKDRITILEDTDGDGKADKVTPFRDDLNIPIGILPVHDGAIAYSIPNIYYFKEDNKKAAEVLLGEFGHKDTHGMVNNFIRGFDGWIHACHGFTNTSVVAGADGDTISMTSGNTFRFRPDGARVEQTTYGRVNPFGYAFDEKGFLYSSDCHSKPVYQLIPGAGYPHFGKKETGIGFAPEMMGYQLGSTAIAGLVYYTGGPFPEEYQHNFYTGDVVTCRVDRNSVSYEGTTPVAKREADFLTSSDPWFRPVDIKLGPDGALYIADFYNKIIGHYEVALDHPERDRKSGRIWRIAYTGGKKIKPSPATDWSEAGIEELLAGLSHPQINTRMKVADRLTDVWKEKAVGPVRNMLESGKTSEVASVQGLWILNRLNALPADLHLSALNSTSDLVRIHAIRIAGEQPVLNHPFYPIIIQALQHQNPFVRRVAAEVLGKFTNTDNLAPLLELYKQTRNEDSHLKYTTLLSIRNNLNDRNVMNEVLSKKWADDDQSILSKASLDLNSIAAATYILNFTRYMNLTSEQSIPYYEYMGRTLPPTQLSEAAALAKNRFRHNNTFQFEVFNALKRGIMENGNHLPPEIFTWGATLANGILLNNYIMAGNIPADVSEKDFSELTGAISLAGEFKMLSTQPMLWKFFDSKNHSLKVSAAQALISISPQYAAQLAPHFNDPDIPGAVKEKLAPVLAQVPSEDVYSALQKGLAGASRKLQTVIATVLSERAESIPYLLEAINNEEIPGDILNENQVRDRLASHATPENKKEIEKLLAGNADERSERKKLIEDRINGFNQVRKNPEAGKVIFEQQCATCHQIRGAGGSIGPNLDGIGNWGPKTLTEKILDPNRNISEAFRTFRIVLKDGKQLTGLYRRTQGQSMIFADAGGQEFTVQKDNIRDYQATSYTLMPDAFRHIIPENEYYNLLSYLLSVK